MLKEPTSLYITPTRFNENTISPQNLMGLKYKYDIGLVYIFDRIVGAKRNALITDHINRSGVTFLRGKTPHKTMPMFPDLSTVYIKEKNIKGCVVQTLGPKKFNKPPNEAGVVFSEAAAITSTLWHYIGVRVKCFGVCCFGGKTNPLKPV